MIPPLYEYREPKGLRLNLHIGQIKAIKSKKRFIHINAGTQSGKSEFAVIWMMYEMLDCGSGEYLAVSPTYPLQKKKVEPVYVKFFESQCKFGHYLKSDKMLILDKKNFKDKPCVLHFGSADRPGSLESATIKAIHMDEVGQRDFKYESYDALLRRLSISKGRVLGTTTLYNFGWYKTEVYDRWVAGDPDYEIIRFDSIMNPAFSLDEWERAKRTLPEWRFNMYYRGIYAKPAGMVFDCFESTEHIIKDFVIPLNWPRYIALDFGGVNTIAIWIAEEKINEQISKYYVYREYHDGNKTGKEHAEIIRRITGNEWLIATIGGAKSENQWRIEFKQGGLNIIPDIIGDVEIGVSKIYSLFKEKRLFIFDSCKTLIDQIGNYSRKLDMNNQPTDEIEDKASYHEIDALRYFAGYITRPKATIGVASVNRG